MNLALNRSRLSFLNRTSFILVSGNPPEAPKDIERADNFATGMKKTTSVMGAIAGLSLILSLASGGAPSGPIITLVRLFKLFFR